MGRGEYRGIVIIIPVLGGGGSVGSFSSFLTTSYVLRVLAP